MLHRGKYYQIRFDRMFVAAAIVKGTKNSKKIALKMLYR